MKLSFSKFMNEYKHVFLFCILCGLVSHGVMLFNKFTWHDDSSALFGVPGWEMGRWLVSFLGWAAAKITSGYNYSLPLINGLISIVIIALSCCLCEYLLEIKNKYLRMALGAVFVSFPVVTATFGYMFLAPYYFLALFSAAAGAVLITRKNQYLWIPAGICFCGTAALYPAFISVFLSLMLLWLLKEVYKGNTAWKSFFAAGFRFAAASAAGMFLYALGNKFFLWYTDSRLITYQGINAVGSTRIKDYLSGIKNAYRFFFVPSSRNTSASYRSSFLYLIGIEKIYFVILFLAIVIAVFMLWKEYKQSIRKALQAFILLVLFPAAVNFIFIMCPSEKTIIHTLMVYGEVFLFVFAAWGTEHVLAHIQFSSLRKPFLYAGMASLSVIGLLFVYLDNVVYLRMQLQYDQYKSDMTVLAARIRSEADYKDEMPVVFIFTGHKDAAVPEYPEFAEINSIIPYGPDYMYPAENKYGLINFLKNTCGFAPPILDESQYAGLEEVQQMPAYPDSGSIQIIDHVVVVKL